MKQLAFFIPDHYAWLIFFSIAALIIFFIKTLKTKRYFYCIIFLIAAAVTLLMGNYFSIKYVRLNSNEQGLLSNSLVLFNNNVLTNEPYIIIPTNGISWFDVAIKLAKPAAQKYYSSQASLRVYVAYYFNGDLSVVNKKIFKLAGPDGRIAPQLIRAVKDYSAKLELNGAECSLEEEYKKLTYSYVANLGFQLLAAPLNYFDPPSARGAQAL